MSKFDLYKFGSARHYIFFEDELYRMFKGTSLKVRQVADGTVNVFVPRTVAALNQMLRDDDAWDKYLKRMWNR